MIQTAERKVFAPRDEPAAEVRNATLKLLAYCQANDWAGYDPYDALNSELLKSLPFLNFKLARLALTQTLKRSPVNFRRLWQIPKTHNPKGLALFVPALLKLSRLGLLPQEEPTGKVIDKLVALRSENSPYCCWGYNFAWQTRTVLVPRRMPNIICTTFAGHALLDVYQVSQDSTYLQLAVSAAEFILKVLYEPGSHSDACFSYTPLGRSQVHNANLLGAAFLCRVSKETSDKSWLQPALKAARFSVSRQYDDGSWDYSEASTQRWKDNFHTGFNLCALRSIGRYAETSEFESSVQRGFEFYKRHFFRDDGAPKYFHDRTYPIDIHSVAQSIITLLALTDLDDGNVALAWTVSEWAMANMWDERGYFYHQKIPGCTNKIPYMRWGQAWMLLALATLLEQQGELVSRNEPWTNR
jgi:rhamnogalacturonyl hydrolase YesR